jgi:hypothetical protein
MLARVIVYFCGKTVKGGYVRFILFGLRSAGYGRFGRAI